MYWLVPWVVLLLAIPASGVTPKGDHRFEVRHRLLKRTYLLHVPAAYTPQKMWPLVIAIHGGGGDGEGMQKLSGWDQKADREGFLVAYPDGFGKKLRGKTVGSWNGGRCCPPASKRKIDDVGFISKLIDQVNQKFSLDQGRVYATGHSNGGIMAYRLACELSEKIAAIGPMGAQGVFHRCEPSRHVPILHIHGTKDRCALFQGGDCGGCFTEYLSEMTGKEISSYTWACESVPEHMEYWRKKYGLSSPAQEIYKKGNVQCLRYGPGPRAEEVNLCKVEGMGHAYPGGALPLPCREGVNLPKCQSFLKIVGESSNEIIPTDLLWDFFKRHHL